MQMNISKKSHTLWGACMTIAVILGYYEHAKAAPPFSGTTFISPEIVTSQDPSLLQSFSSAGRGNRWMFDRRVNDWIYVDAFLVDADFSDGLSIEVQINPEFGDASAAMSEAEKWLPPIGQLPTELRAQVNTVWIHKGIMPFGGGNNNLLIHTGQGDLYIQDGYLEEVLIHESAHTSVDTANASSAGWLSAQQQDGEFISTYARDNPDREDIAESILPYIAIRYKADRISEGLKNTIVTTIPYRIDYFDSQSFDFSPYQVCAEQVQNISGLVVNDIQEISTCSSIHASDIFIGQMGGLTLRAGESVSINSPFSVEAGGTLSVFINSSH